MAGHSKWANIQHRKKAQDAKRGKLFTKLIREITVATKIGGPQPDSNPRLRMAIDKAYADNVNKTSVERAIKRGSGEVEEGNYQEVVYEGYAPGGIAVLVECMTDNKNRAVAEIRHAFTRNNGNLGTSGSVAYLFSKKGVLSYPKEYSEDDITQSALEANADDLLVDEDIQVLTDPAELFAVRDAMEKAGFKATDCEYQMHPFDAIAIGQDDAIRVIRLMEGLDDCDDVQNVYCNADFPDDLVMD